MIKLLDCTLRDGGYVNEWRFGKNTIKDIISKLNDSRIDIIECGFLQEVEYEENKSKFDNIERIKDVLPVKHENQMHVAMIDFGKYENIDNIPVYDGSSIDGLRIAFHKNKMEDALLYCEKIKEKGYKIFMQPMVTMSYSDEELLYLIKKSNGIKPYAFYLVDSFGVMQPKDLKRLIYLVDNNLDEEIALGYHSHNNLQLAYSNAQLMTKLIINREIIIDCSIFGMGRGAGNLNTELFTEYLNNCSGKNYNITPLLEVIDEYLNKIYSENYWGYSLPHYLSAKNNCHPNYATYLSSKNMLSINDINIILNDLDEIKKLNFDKDYARNTYESYQQRCVDNSFNIEDLRNTIKDRNILVLAPGKSLTLYNEEIKRYILKENPILFSVNFMPNDIKVDYVFFSNSKRFDKFKKELNTNNLGVQYIITSNVKLKEKKDIILLDYSKLICKDEYISDNATIMLINLFKQLNVKEIFVAGFDGFDPNTNDNYINNQMAFVMSEVAAAKQNECIKKKIENISDELSIKFLTPSIYKY